jgi:hypothetical protein
LVNLPLVLGIVNRISPSKPRILAWGPRPIQNFDAPLPWGVCCWPAWKVSRFRDVVLLVEPWQGALSGIYLWGKTAIDYTGSSNLKSGTPYVMTRSVIINTLDITYSGNYTRVR